MCGYKVSIACNSDNANIRIRPCETRPRKMERDKNNSSLISSEKLLYLDPPKLQSPHDTQNKEQRPEFYPELSEKAQKIKQVGVFRSVILPSFIENPFVPFGLTMVFVTLGYSVFCMARGKKDKASKYMNIQYGFQVFTVAAVMGGYSYRKYKAKKHMGNSYTEELKEK